MLFDIVTGKKVTHIPHENSFNTWKNRLSPQEFDDILIELDKKIDGDEIHTSSWMPGNDWVDTVYFPIYQQACGNNKTDSGLFFGLIVWYVFQSRSDEWYFGRFEKDGTPINGMTYFKKK